jgi:hypothetical protein
MTSNQVRDLLRNSVGKRVTLESDRAVLSGTLHGIDGEYLLVRGVSSVPLVADEKPHATPAGAIQKWGMPPQNVSPRFIGGQVIFSWERQRYGERHWYRLTICSS